ncbi:hypothetical protein KEM52_003964 [Ascosphaera acerosa]|nr:hypothetical protein KEM52_003964 [Ascosphaera acerosa]
MGFRKWAGHKARSAFKRDKADKPEGAISGTHLSPGDGADSSRRQGSISSFLSTAGSWRKKKSATSGNNNLPGRRSQSYSQPSGYGVDSNSWQSGTEYSRPQLGPPGPGEPETVQARPRSAFGFGLTGEVNSTPRVPPPRPARPPPELCPNPALNTRSEIALHMDRRPSACDTPTIRVTPAFSGARWDPRAAELEPEPEPRSSRSSFSDAVMAELELL